MPIRVVVLLVALSIAAGGSRAGPAGLALPDPWSAAAAEQVLADGGNAVDAAVAAAFVLAVTYPQAGNIGGGGFLLGTFDGEAYFLDFRERAPAAAQRDMYLDEQGRVVSELSMVGSLAVGVPGTVRGLAAAHRRFGSRPWPDLVAPAIRLAREGFVIPAGMAALVAERLEEVGGETNFAEYFGTVRDGQRFRQPELGATLALIAADPDSFYQGLPARQLVAQMRASGGLVTLRDLADYRAVWRQPLHESLEIAAHLGIGVLAEHQGGAGMVTEHMREAAHLGPPNNCLHLSRNIDSAAPGCSDGERFLKCHRIRVPN